MCVNDNNTNFGTVHGTIRYMVQVPVPVKSRFVLVKNTEFVLLLEFVSVHIPAFLFLSKSYILFVIGKTVWFAITLFRFILLYFNILIFNLFFLKFHLLFNFDFLFIISFIFIIFFICNREEGFVPLYKEYSIASSFNIPLSKTLLFFVWALGTNHRHTKLDYSKYKRILKQQEHII